MTLVKMVATGHKIVAATTQRTLCIGGEALSALTSFGHKQEGVAGPASQPQGCLRAHETMSSEEGCDFLGKGHIWLPAGVGHPSLLILVRVVFVILVV